MTDVSFWQAQGAVLAPDGIPLHFGDQQAEYVAALEQAVVMDRSHEGRMWVEGRDRLALLQRISTNHVLALRQDEGCPTILTNPNGRILDRLMVYHCGEQALLVTEPGRGEAVRGYLQRQIFFNDDVRLSDLSTTTRLLVLHGPLADAVVASYIGWSVEGLAPFAAFTVLKNELSLTFLRRKALSGGHWAILVPAAAANRVWDDLRAVGSTPAGSLTYNVLRIRSGRPGVGRELTTDYIPLEAGLWDEVSFNKGCYTGQEIIARMESRGRLAKTLVHLHLAAPVETPAALVLDDKTVGTLTSSVLAPDGVVYGLGFVRVGQATPGQTLSVGDDRIRADIMAYAGAQPPISGD